MKEDDLTQLYNVGDILYKVSLYKNEYNIEPIKITRIEKYPHCVYIDDKRRFYYNHTITKSCFKTREEAELEINRRQTIAHKKELLKEYEAKLNEELCIKDNIIVK